MKDHKCDSVPTLNPEMRIFQNDEGDWILEREIPKFQFIDIIIIFCPFCGKQLGEKELIE